MTKRTEKTGGTQGASTEATALARLLAPLVDGMTTTRHQLLTWVQSAGLVALDAVFREEAAALAGPKGRHEPTRTHHHWGATPRQLTFGGRQLSLSCPRVRSREGQEAALPSVRAFREKDPLTTRVMDQLLLGVSTRGYAASLEVAPAGTRSRATSKSAVSRRLVAATRTQLTAQLGRRLDELDLVALFLDGVHVAGQTLIAALGVAADGSKTPLGIRLGSTENAAICTELLQDLVTRGLRLDGRVLCVIDGAKGLRKALEDVLGTRAVIQRCQLHKQRNLLALVPHRRQPFVRAALRRAYRAASAAAARRQLQALASWLETNSHPDAAASLREGLEETLTVLKLELPSRLRRFFATTNCIENLIATLRHVTRNVKRWRAGDMIHRWAGLGLLRAAARFRRIKHHHELPHLVRALRPDTSTEVAA
jgi:transposase-like protein